MTITFFPCFSRLRRKPVHLRQFAKPMAQSRQHAAISITWSKGNGVILTSTDQEADQHGWNQFIPLVIWTLPYNFAVYDFLLGIPSKWCHEKITQGVPGMTAQLNFSIFLPLIYKKMAFWTKHCNLAESVCTVPDCRPSILL